MKKRGELSNGLPPELSGGGDSEPRPAGLNRATELELIDAALLGDMQAFSDIFEHYRPALNALCCRRLNDDSLAEDVVQEVFLKAFESLPHSDHRKPMWPWLATIAYRMCIDLQRRRSFTFYSEDIGVFVDADVDQTVSAIDKVIASEERAEFWRSLEVLPERQRRVLLLYAVDGLSGAEIASAEGISAAAVRRLLFRARRKMWAERQSGPLPAIVLPFTWLGWKFQRIEERVRMLLAVYGEGFSTACVQALCLSTVAMMVVAASHPTESFDGSDPIRSGETVLSATQSRPLQTASLQTAGRISALPPSPPVESQQSVVDPASSLVDNVINPSKNATPENSSLYSLTASPNYESDHTVLAAGHYWQSHALFVSHDGGASWKPQVSRVPLGIQYNMVLSPGYPQDRRVFTLGELGLQQSDDGGEIFRIVSPVLGPSLTISPSFGRGDSKILIGGKTPVEYDADIGITQPGSLALPPSWGAQSYYTSITFSPSYPSDPTVFISDKYGRGDMFNSRLDQTILYRCKGPVCDQTAFPFPGPMAFRLSPRFEQDGLVYAFAGRTLLVSNDGGQAFQQIQIPLSNYGYITDVAIWWNASSGPIIFVSISGRPSGIFRSLDAGRSWNSSPIEVLGFQYGAKKLIVTPTGRLLAMGSEYGLACSEDNGLAWAPRCPPES